jgi:NTE family protein
MRFHLIDASDSLAHLPSETKVMPHRPFLQRLFEQGRQRTQAWLAQEGRRVGQVATVDLQALFQHRRDGDIDQAPRLDVAA